MPQRLYDAADRGDAAAVAEFLREGDDANEAANDWAPLHVACFKGHFDAVKALLEGGADVKATVRAARIEAHLQAQTAELQNEAGGTKSLWGCCLQRRGKKTGDARVAQMDNLMC